MNRTLTLLLCGVALTLASSAAAELNGPDSRYRQVGENGIGNCIFSDGQLLFQKEEGYTVREAFAGPEKIVESRCYFPRMLAEYGQLGGFFNSLRDEGGRYNHWAVVTDSEGNIEWEDVGVYHADDSSYRWDQQRLVWDPASSSCAGKDSSKFGTNGCLDPDKRIREIARQEGASLPYTGRVCVFFFINWSDQYDERWDEARGRWERNAVNVQTTNLAAGCVDYTVK